MSIQTESVNNTILKVTIDRPNSLNALNHEVLSGLVETFSSLSSSIRVVVITGAGERAFVAGADIATMNELGSEQIAQYVDLGQRAMRMIEECKLPVIAAVNGFALGGGMELALACDVIFASTSAKFGQPEVNLGIIPGFGGTQRLLHRCGIGTARRLILSGEIISAEEAHRLHIVDKLFAPDQLTSEVKKFAELLASKAPLAVQGAKRVLGECEHERLGAGLRLEVAAFLKLFESSDRKEGMHAFLEKRSAEFKGQ